jgi:hypothetical protein
VRIGVGASLDGQIALTAGELSVTGELGAQLEVGWECGGATATCQSLQTLTPINTIKPKYEVFNPQTGMRVKLEGQFYVFAALDAVFATVFHVGILEAKAGPVQSVDLGFEEDQALNPGYASKYDLKLEAVVQPGSGLQAVLDNILSGISLTFRTKFSKDISESPSGVLTVSHPIVPPSGQSVDIKVDLRNTDYFLIGYNVVRVELWRKKPDSSSFSRMRAFDVTASNQSIFTYTWQPTVDDLGTTEFAAFVYTEFPVPGLEVAPNSIAKVLVSCFSAAPRGVARVVGAANTCADEWQGTATFFQPGMIQIEVVATWRRDPASTDPGRVDYIATGVATVKWLDYENKGCSVTPTVFPFTSSGGLTVEYSDDPPSYGFLAAIPLPVTVTCDGMSLDVPHSGLWLVGSGRVSANGTQIRGRNDAGDGIFWDWSFGRP